MGGPFTTDNFRILNYRTAEKAAWLSEIDQLAAGRVSPVLCLVDEINGRSGDAWRYQSLLPSLDLNTWENRHGVFVLAGSGGGGINELVEIIKGSPKGADLLARIPESNRFAIPKPLDEDRLVRFAEQVFLASSAAGRVVSEIERFALYFILKNEALFPTSQLAELAKTSVEKITDSDGRLFYEHLFRAGDRLLLKFWQENDDAAKRLQGPFVSIEE